MSAPTFSPKLLRREKTESHACDYLAHGAAMWWKSQGAFFGPSSLLESGVLLACLKSSRLHSCPVVTGFEGPSVLCPYFRRKKQRVQVTQNTLLPTAMTTSGVGGLRHTNSAHPLYIIRSTWEPSVPQGMKHDIYFASRSRPAVACLLQHAPSGAHTSIQLARHPWEHTPGTKAGIACLRCAAGALV